MLQLRVFGPLDLVGDDGTTVLSVLSQPKRTALLVYLALAHPPGFHRRDTLLALFWPERDRDHARRSLNQSLYRLRQYLGPEVIQARGREEVGISDGTLWCDAAAFRAALDAGDRVGALELYRGELLEGFHVSGAPEFERWLARERSSLRDSSRRAAAELAEATRDPAEARVWLERALEIAPADEAVVRRLMQVLDLTGDRAGALRAYEMLVTRLERTLGVEPSPETHALAEQVRARDRARPEAIPALAADAPKQRDGAARSASAADSESGAASLSPEAPSLPDGGGAEGPRPGRRRAYRHLLVAGMGSVALLAGAGWWLSAGSGGSGPRVERLAVLPLSNLNDPDQEYFVQGMHDRLISELQQAGIAVIARTSVMRYGKAREPVREIARDLRVDALVEGSVFRSGDSLDVEVRLVDVATEEYTWQGSFHGHLRSVAALQSDLVRAIAQAVRVALDPETEARLAEIREVDPRAYEAYLNGLFHMRRITREDLNIALEYLETALEIDSTYAPALVGIARLWGHRNRVEFLSNREVLEKREPLLRRALALDSALAEAHMILGVTRTWFAVEPDWEGSEESFRRAIDLNPGLGEARLFLAQLLMIRGRWEAALEQARLGLDLDPLNPFAQVMFAQILAFQRRYGEAIGVLEDMFRRNPGAGAGRPVLSGLYHLVERYDDALRVTREEFQARGAQDVVAALDEGFRERGYAGAFRVAADTLASRSRREYVAAVRIAEFYARAGETEKAIDWLEEAFRAGEARMIGVVPIWQGLHDHPRFQALARRANVPILAGTGNRTVFVGPE